MIFCFSGTGNSAYIANRIGKILDEPVNSINAFMKNNKTASASEGERLIFVTPTYAWRIPRVVQEWIGK
jgi:flavodoxin